MAQPKSNLAGKLILDPLDFLEYFCPDHLTYDKFFGRGEMHANLKHFSLSETYSQQIIDRFKLPWIPIPNPSQGSLEEFADLGLKDLEGQTWLRARGFSEELEDRYNVQTFKPKNLPKLPNDISNWWLFNPTELEQRSYELNHKIKAFTASLTSMQIRFQLRITAHWSN